MIVDSTERFYRLRLTASSAKRAVIAAVIVILSLTFLGFPPPVDIETRPQSHVSLNWLVYFVVVLIVEIAAIPMIYRRPSVGGVLGILAAIPNIFILADLMPSTSNLLPEAICLWNITKR
jgi:hypothetical protein